MLTKLAKEIRGDRVAIQRRLNYLVTTLGPLPRKHGETISKLLQEHDEKILGKMGEVLEAMGAERKELKEGTKVWEERIKGVASEVR